MSFAFFDHLTTRFADRDASSTTIEHRHQLLGIWLAYPDQSQVSRLWQLAYHGLNAVCVIAIDLYRKSQVCKLPAMLSLTSMSSHQTEDPKGARADSHRKFLAMSAGRLDRPEYKSRVSQEVMKVVNILVKHLSSSSCEYRTFRSARFL